LVVRLKKLAHKQGCLINRVKYGYFQGLEIDTHRKMENCQIPLFLIEIPLFLNRYQEGIIRHAPHKHLA